MRHSEPLRPLQGSRRGIELALEDSFDEPPIDVDEYRDLKTWIFLKTSADEPLDEEPDAEHTGEDDRIDDPVRIYLMQMGEIPMLSRREERPWRSGSSAAGGDSAIACWPATTCFRRPIGLLENIRDNKLRLDRTIEVSVINVGEKIAAVEGAAAEPANAAPFDAGKPARFRPGHPSAAAARKAAARPGGGC